MLLFSPPLHKLFFWQNVPIFPKNSSVTLPEILSDIMTTFPCQSENQHWYNTTMKSTDLIQTFQLSQQPTLPNSSRILPRNTCCMRLLCFIKILQFRIIPQLLCVLHILDNLGIHTFTFFLPVFTWNVDSILLPLFL